MVTKDYLPGVLPYSDEVIKEYTNIGAWLNVTYGDLLISSDQRDAAAEFWTCVYLRSRRDPHADASASRAGNGPYLSGDQSVPQAYSGQESHSGFAGARFAETEYAAASDCLQGFVEAA